MSEEHGGRSDRELLQAHVDGDGDAFGELFARHRDRLWAVALRTMGNPEDAADGLQDGLIAAYRRAASFRGEAQVTTWLHRVVVNACLDRLRRAKAQPAAAPYDADLGHLRDPAGDPAHRVDTAIVVERALLMLPVEQRAAIVAVDMQGYSVAETAQLLGVAEGTVKSRCARGRAKLARSLRYFDPDERQHAPSAVRRADHA